MESLVYLHSQNLLREPLFKPHCFYFTFATIVFV